MLSCVLHAQCNAVCQACVMATAGMLAQSWEADLPTPKAHLVLCVPFKTKIQITTLLGLSHHACTHSQHSQLEFKDSNLEHSVCAGQRE